MRRFGSQFVSLDLPGPSPACTAHPKNDRPKPVARARYEIVRGRSLLLFFFTIIVVVFFLPFAKIFIALRNSNIMRETRLCNTLRAITVRAGKRDRWLRRRARRHLPMPRRLHARATRFGFTVEIACEPFTPSTAPAFGPTVTARDPQWRDEGVAKCSCGRGASFTVAQNRT